MKLTEDQDKLFTVGFVSQSALITAMRTTGDLILKANVGGTVDRTITYGASAKFLHSSFVFKPTISENGQGKVSLAWTANTNMRLKALSQFAAKGGNIEGYDQSLKADIKLEKGWLTLGLNKALDFSITGKVGTEDYGFGVNSKLSLSQAVFYPFDVAAWYNQAKSKTVLKLERVDLPQRNFGELSASLFLEATPTTKIGSLVKLGLHSHVTSIEVAAEHTLTPATTLKAKIHSKGVVSAAWIEALRPGITFSLSTSVNSLKVFKAGIADAGLGFRLDFSA